MSGQIEEGLCVLEEGLVAAQNHAERFCEADLYRLKGELLLQESVGAALRSAPTQLAAVIVADGEATGQLPRRHTVPMPCGDELCRCPASGLLLEAVARWHLCHTPLFHQFVEVSGDVLLGPATQPFRKVGRINVACDLLNRD